MNTKSLILVRGCPGAGKTTFAETIAGGAPVVSADDYFMSSGKYVFVKDKLNLAHTYCQRRVTSYMLEEKPRIFVANTFTTEKEMKIYFDMAKTYKYKVFTIIVENRHGNDSIHSVPEGTVEIMKKRFDVKL